MARSALDFKNNYSLSVESVLRGHHVYKETWNPYKGEKLMSNHDKREEAKIFENYAGSKTNMQSWQMRVGKNI